MSFVCGGDIKIFSGNSNVKLAQDIAKKLNIEMGKSEVRQFSDGETYLRINETVRNSDIFLIQSTSAPANHHIMELLIMIDAMKRASAGRITAVIPYYGYARQDRKARARDPISAKLVANLITSAGADKIITMDLHCPQIQGFFDIPLDHLDGIKKFRDYYFDKFSEEGLKDAIVVSPDLGSLARSRMLAAGLNIPIAIVDKRRPNPNESVVMNIIGDVSGKKVIIVDDIIDTAGSFGNAAEALMKAGAVEIYAGFTHGVLSGGAYERIDNSLVKEVLVFDTIAQNTPPEYDKIKCITVADIFAEAISRVHLGMSVSDMWIL